MKYWAYINSEILGPYEKDKLLELQVFSASTLICPQTPVGEKTGDWKEASSYPELAELLGAPKPAPAQEQQAPAADTAPAASADQQAQAMEPAPAPEPEKEQQTPGADAVPPATADQQAPDASPAQEQQTPAADTPSAAPADQQAQAQEQQAPAADTAPAASADRQSQDAPPAPASAEEHFKNDAGTRSNKDRSEHLHQLFTNDIPGAKLKPLSFHPIDQAEPAPAPDEKGLHFEITRLGGGKEPPKKDEPVPTPNFTGSSFDPISLSRINRRSEISDAEPPKRDVPAPAEPETKSPETLPPPVPVPPSPEAAPVAGPEIQEQAASTDKKILDDIASRFETLNKTFLTKQDIAPLNEKLGRLEQTLSLMNNERFQRELMDKIRFLETAFSDMRDTIAQAASKKSFEGAVINPPPPSPYGPVPAAAERKQPAEAAKPEIIDHGSRDKESWLPGLIKKSSKFVITLILLAAGAAVAAFGLKQAGVFDVTKFLPFRTPLSSPQQPAEAPAPQPFQTDQAAPEVQTQPARKDLADEVIAIGKAFAVKSGGATLEGRVFEDAAARKGDFSKAVWQAKELRSGLFELDAVIPSMDGGGQLTYRYEVDYATKMVKPLDDASAKPLDPVLKENQAPAQNKTQIKKIRKGTAALKGRQQRPAAKPAGKHKTKQAKGPQPAAGDDEYEYVYEDEAAGGAGK